MTLPHRIAGARLGGALAALVLSAACSAPQSQSAPPRTDRGPMRFSAATLCRGCHVDIYEQHSQSVHNRSFTNPVFQAQFYNDYLPRFHDEPGPYANEPACLSCHAPISYLDKGLMLAKQVATTAPEPDCENCHVAAQQTGDVEALNDQSLGVPGVTCDICHRIEGFRGLVPGNGNYIAKPGTQKFGPFEHGSDWHHVYNELQTQSIFCAMCHESVNRYGVAVRTTYREWQRSRFAEDGIHCQECHMSLNGGLVDGKLEFASGRAAQMTLGNAPLREKLYTHRFSGAHDGSQLAGALGIKVDFRDSTVEPGTKVRFRILVDNSMTGHRMPSGSVELRIVWLDVQARIGERPIDVRLSGVRDAWNITYGQDADRWILENQVPAGRRVYRAVFTGKDGEPTLKFFDAVDRIYDNRLEAGEVRSEVYYLDVPGDVEGEVRVEATLRYLRYPAGFASLLGVERVEAHEVSRAEAVLDIRG